MNRFALFDVHHLTINKKDDEGIMSWTIISSIEHFDGFGEINVLISTHLEHKQGNRN